MKKIFLILLVFAGFAPVLTAQQTMKDYAKEWTLIDSLTGKAGLTQDALTAVNKIYNAAVLEKNQPQVLKTLIYQLALESNTQEDAGLKAIQKLEIESAKIAEPGKSVINSMIASSYWQYFQNNRWKLYDRTATNSSVAGDPATWAAEDFHSAISRFYLASLKNERLLQMTSLDGFEAILNKGNTRKLRPTLFDFLAHRALEYFTNQERTITEPAYSFSINNESAFAPAPTFIKVQFNTSDTTSLYFRSLVLYQKLLAFHLNDQDKAALIDADISRLTFVNQYGVMADKETLYYKALTTITEVYPKSPETAQAYYLLAAVHAEKARMYVPGVVDRYRYAWIEALKFAKAGAAYPDSSEGKTNSLNLLNEIQQETLSMTLEEANLPGQPFRTLIGFRNFTKLYFRIVTLDRDLKTRLRDRQDENYWTTVMGLPVLKIFEQSLPDTRDYQMHTTEVKVDALPVGEYLIISSPDSSFKTGKHPIAAHSFYVTNLAFIRRNNDYFALHRETGAPLEGAAIQTWYTYYDYTTRKNNNRKGQALTAGKNGLFVLEPSAENNRQQLRLEISSGNDHYFPDQVIYQFYPGNNLINQPATVSYLFSDRAIYRPGQQVYFKGIVIKQQDGMQPTAATAVTSTIYLQDANGQNIDSLQLKTNQYGSYNGSFRLPAGTLAGNFQIVDKNNNSVQSISVEEYKRPKFAVKISNPDSSYVLGDSVLVKGNALGYAGNNIDGAKVSYRITRNPNVIYLNPYGRWQAYPPRFGRGAVISNGITVTDQDGNFSITFKAAPDAAEDSNSVRTFNYEIEADVTDNSGETRSVKKQIVVGYTAVRLELQVPEKISVDSVPVITLRSMDLNDEFKSVPFTLKMTALKQPGRIMRSRLWEAPDTMVIDRNNYLSAFPYDIYQNEDAPLTWPRLSTVATFNDTTNGAGKVQLPASAIKEGWYLIEITGKDSKGKELRDSAVIQIYNQAVNTHIAGANLIPATAVANAGTKLPYTITTNLDQLFVIRNRANSDTQTIRDFFWLNKKPVTASMDITAADLGGTAVDIAFVKNNRFYSSTAYVAVPYPGKDLKIEYTSFRDKTLPGSKEQWSMKITGAKADKVNAELLATMYDASLDAFRPNQFLKPGIWKNFYPEEGWESTVAFKASLAAIIPTEQEWISFDKEYDRLFSLNELYGSGSGIRFALPGASRAIKIRGLSQVKAAPADMALNESSLTRQSVEADTVSTSTPDAPLRTNLAETAFFFPDLKTDSSGNVTLNFTMPEALTTWKFLALAHTPELAIAVSEKSVVTQKDLMVQPNAPRFVRQGDIFDFTGKIINLTDTEMTGQVELQLIDPTTGQPVDGWFKNVFPNQFFTAGAKQSVPVNFSIEIPFQYNKALTYRLFVKSGDKSDGEEGMLPVLSNRQLVTESLTLPVRGTGTKNFQFARLLNSAASETINHHSLTVEFTSNPAWLAIQALPYLSENPRPSSDQVFNNFYSNSLADIVIKSSPAIRDVFKQWSTDSSALMSKLERNQELKTTLLAETPWVMQARNESQRKQMLASFFDDAKITAAIKTSLQQLQGMQSPDGGFKWFPGGPDDRYITQYIMSGLGRLARFDPSLLDDPAINSIISPALAYMDNAIKSDYDLWLKNSKSSTDSAIRKNAIKIAPTPGNLQFQYLYARSFFRGNPIPGNVMKAYTHYRDQARKNWLKQNRFIQASIALALHRSDDLKTASAIVASLKQNAISHPELGMYWKDLKAGYYWYQAPVETQAVLIEAFAEIARDSKSVDNMKTWLLKQKQTQMWSTSRATADACYALMLSSAKAGKPDISAVLLTTPGVAISLGGQVIEPSKQEAGSGYFSKNFAENQVKPSMGKIEVTVKQPAGSAQLPAWGAVYWQYFDDLDAITASGGSIQLSKKLFVQRDTDKGKQLEELQEGIALKTGDKLVVRLVLKTDRDMEYLHLKDMRAAGTEPVNVLSSYKWQGGLGYYESTSDASTNFYFNYIPRGSYVFEYPVFVTHTGRFSNGIATLQSVYAPEFSSHTGGTRITVE